MMHGGEFRQGRALIFESQPLVSREDTSCNEMQIRTEVAQSVLESTPAPHREEQTGEEIAELQQRQAQ